MLSFKILENLIYSKNNAREISDIPDISEDQKYSIMFQGTSERRSKRTKDRSLFFVDLHLILCPWKSVGNFPDSYSVNRYHKISSFEILCTQNIFTTRLTHRSAFRESWLRAVHFVWICFLENFYAYSRIEQWLIYCWHCGIREPRM